MSSFSRPPEWQQPADRHTALTDPVLTVRQLARFEFNRRSHSRIDHALVFATPKGTYDTYLPPRRPTRSEAAAKRYSAVYEVDMGVHPVRTQLALPSEIDAFEFGAEVDLSWQVVDPGRFVESGHRDVPALLVGELQQAARPVTRRFPADRSAEAEAELLGAMRGLGPLGATAGLQVTWTLRLRRDQGAIDQQHRLREARHGYQQQDLQLQLQADYERRYHVHALEQQNRQHELAMAQGRYQIELQRVQAEKIAFYQWHLQQGGVHALALHLSEHPEDSALVMNSMREDQLRMIQAQMSLVQQLLSGGNAESYELEGPKQLALQTVNDILTQRLPGVPNTPPMEAPPEVGAGPAAPPAAPGGYGPVPGQPGQPAAPGPYGTGLVPPGTGPGEPGGPRPQPAAPGAPTPPAPQGPPNGPIPMGSAAPAGPGGNGTGPAQADPRPYAPGAPTPPAPAVPGRPLPGPYAGGGPGAPVQPPEPGWQPPPGYGTVPVHPGPPPAPAAPVTPESGAPGSAQPAGDPARAPAPAPQPGPDAVPGPPPEPAPAGPTPSTRNGNPATGDAGDPK